MRRLFAVAAVVVWYCGATASTLVTLPKDLPVAGGYPVTAICGDCCQAGSYCDVTKEDVKIPDPSDHSRQSLVQKGTAMTCMLRARNAPGAIDGGLCVPTTFPLTADIASFCQADKQVGRAIATLRFRSTYLTLT